MIAHVAQSGEDRGRVVLHLRSSHPSTMAVEAALRVARAFGSDLESLFVEDEQLFDCAAYSFAREVSLSGAAKPGHVARCHDARSASGGAGRATPGRGAGAQGGGAAALPGGARRAVAGAVHRLRGNRAVERGGPGRTVHRQRHDAEAVALGGFRLYRARHGRPEGAARHRPRRRRRGRHGATAGPAAHGGTPGCRWTMPRSCCC